ncbi:hypothetical protein RCO27_05485 [Sphingosinicella sp. LHD-64]|uniref:hypothetical protein n=1 Tax=Sphingosinicella sp. LHD-64 TaxID=3072139 RepID=UPI00280FB20E|nr:hypothetical protein [Sphingosinicella sp. LHD-64]MDQ8755675.1 hypothetical protein [Sphingosinicella sp. LHD-64]
MRSLLFALALFVAPAAAVAQSDEAAVMAPIDAMFAGLTARDGQAILAQVRGDGAAAVVVERPDGTRSFRRMSWADFAGGIRPGAERLEERMPDPLVRIDGDIAMVWGQYDFLVDGRRRHCGVNHFDLVRENGAWKVQNVTWTQRTEGCGE